jgi:hypothetical protein
MDMNNFRNSVLLLIVSSVVIPSLAWGDLKKKSENSYNFINIGHLDYGTNDDQIGLLQEPGVPPAGPESFWVNDKGLIYVCDTTNKKIKLFSAQGEFIDQVSVNFKCNDVAVNDQGNIFVMDSARKLIHCFSMKQLLSVMAVDKSLISKANLLSISDSKLEIITNDQERYLMCEPEQLSLLDAEKNNGNSNDKVILRKPIVKKNNSRLSLKRTENRKAEITFLDNDSNSHKASRKKTPNKTVLPVSDVVSSTFLGSDRTGNCYIQVEQMGCSDSNVNLCVYVLDPEGKTDCVIDKIPNNYWTYTAKLLQVNGQGDIYQLLPTEQGIEINCWKRNK